MACAPHPVGTVPDTSPERAARRRGRGGDVGLYVPTRSEPWRSFRLRAGGGGSTLQSGRDRCVGAGPHSRGAGEEAGRGSRGPRSRFAEPCLLLFSPATTQSRARHPLFGADVRSLLLVLSNCPSGRKYHVSFACETLGPPRRDGMTRCSVFVLFDSYLESPLIGEAFLRCIKRDGSLREIAIPNAGSPLIKPLLVRC